MWYEHTFLLCTSKEFQNPSVAMADHPLASGNECVGIIQLLMDHIH